MPGGRTHGVASSVVDIDGGTITGVTLDNTAIGNTTTTTGKFTAVTATGLTVNGNSVLGSTSAATIGFYSSTNAVAQRQSSVAPAVATTAAINSSISSSCFGFTSAQAAAIVALVNELRAAAVAIGLIAT